MGYLKETIKGVSWMGALRGSTRIIAFFKLAIFARVLSPFQFGLYAIAQLVLVFLEILTETGINVFFIQGEGRIKKYIDTAWIVSIARGVIIFLLIIISAPLFSLFFKNDQSRDIVLLISVVPLVRGFINPAIVKFQKQLQFKKEFLIRLSVFSFDAVIAVALLITTRSVYSLVWGNIAGALFELALSYIFIKPWPKFAFEFAKAKRVVERGKWVTAYGVFTYLFENLDDIVVGRLLTTHALGVYQMAYKISSLPISEIANVVSKVSFPVYSKISDDKVKIYNTFKKVTLTVAMFVIPMGVILFFFSEEIVMIILGDKWIQAGPVIRVLAAFGVIRAVMSVSNNLFLALKKQEYVTTITFFGIIAIGVSVYPLTRSFGIVGAAYSALIGVIVSIPVFLYFLHKTIVELSEYR